MYKLLLKPLLFLLSPEQAHRLTMGLLKVVLAIPIVGKVFSKFYTIEDSRLERNVLGLRFPNPVGLAAGFDKNGTYFREMSKLGFGFIEVGTVTPKPQAGNPKPRLFRLPKDNALINRMGFNNEGVAALVEQLKKRNTERIIIGGNIGKNKDTPNEAAVQDYVLAFEQLFPVVDYFVVNVSSPNTPNLRELQDKEPLTHLLNTLQQLNKQQNKSKPILLKIAPDLTNGQLDDIIEIVEATQLEGIIATNTTIERSGLQSSHLFVEKIGAGGLSGQPLRERSTDVIRYIHNKTAGRLVIIGVGGINSPDDALEKLNAGASLIQIYTGLIYEGPALIKNINQRLLQNT